jgi:hypothetical protein
MPINPTTLKALIDTQITNETVDFAITPTEVGSRMKDTIDYTTEQIALAEVLTNKSTNVTTDGASDTKYPSVKAVKTYVDANAGVSVMKNIKVTLSSAQILALNTTPIELVPAVTGKLLVPQFLFQKYNHVSTPYTTSGLFRIGLGSITFGFSAFGAVITSADNSQGLNNFGYSQSTSGLTYQNLPLIIGATTANPTGGNGTLDLYLTYLEVTI